MFSDYESPIVGFSSISQAKRDARNLGTQTSERPCTDQVTQASESKNVGTETERIASLKPADYNEQSLLDFLKRIAPLVHDELDIEADFSEIDQDGSEEESSLVRLDIYDPPPSLSQHKISSLSWNSTGGTLAAAFSAIRHEAWCNHESQVVLYRMATQKLTQPRTFLTASCVTCIQFHPIEPSVIVAGLYNGETRVWDLRKDDDWEIADSNSEHGTQVIQVGWCSENTFFAAFADGSILLQKLSPTNRSAAVLERFLVARYYLNPKIPDHDQGLDLMAVGQLAPDILVVGTGGGGLLQCTLSALQPLTRRPEYKDPVTLVYQPHQTAITAIRSAPSGKNFASASSDGQIRVYKSSEKEAEFVVNIKGCPLDIFWTDSPSILGICGLENRIIFVKTTKGNMLTSEFALTGNDGATVTQSMKNRGIVAVGNECGKVETWRVSLSKRSH